MIDKQLGIIENTLMVTSEKFKEPLTVTHLEFQEWPEMEIPEATGSILNLYKIVRHHRERIYNQRGFFRLVSNDHAKYSCNLKY